MALTYDQISATTQKNYIPRLVDNIFDSDPLWQRARDRGWYESKNGGTTIMQPLMYAVNGAVGSYNPTDTLDTSDSDQFTSAEFNWKHYYANISVTEADELKNSGDSQVLNFVKNKVMAAEMSLKDSLQDGLYSAGTTASDIGGLRLIVDSGNTVGGISQSTYTWWASTEDSSTTTFSLSAYQTKFNQLSVNGKSPTVSVATRSIYNSAYALLQPQQRFVDAKTAQAGFSSIMLNGIPLIASPKCPSQHLFLLNEEFLHLYYHPNQNMRFQPFQMPTNQQIKIARVLWMGNLGSSNNRMHAKFTALAA
jgi:hypothetical protein